MTVDVDLLLNGATLTRSADSDWTVGTIWFDPDAETGGLVTGTGSTQGTSNSLGAASTFTRAPGFQKVTVTGPPDTGGLLDVTALGTLTQSTAAVVEIKLNSDVAGGQWPLTRLPATQAFTVVGNLRLEPGQTAEVWVEYRYASGSAASVDAGVLLPVFHPAGNRPGATSDAWGRYWNGDQWVPPVLQAASMTFATGTTPLPTKTATTTTVAVSPPWVEVGHMVTAAATVTGGGTGSVMFAVSQVSAAGPWSAVGSVPLVGGVATRTWLPDLVGNLWVQASYQGDATHLTSTGVSGKVPVVEEGGTPPPPPPYGSVVLADTPWGFWRFAPAALLADSSPNARTLSLQGSFGPDTATAIAGPKGDSTHWLNRSGSYGGPNVSQPTTMTYECWLYLSVATPAAQTMLMTFSGSGASGVTSGLMLETSGKITMANYPTGNVTAPTALTTGAWHHLVGSTGAAGTKLRIDKTTVATNGATSALSAATGLFRIRNGGPNATAGTADLHLAECAVWYGSQLTDLQTDAHFDAGPG